MEDKGKQGTDLRELADKLGELLDSAHGAPAPAPEVPPGIAEAAPGEAPEAPIAPASPAGDETVGEPEREETEIPDWLRNLQAAEPITPAEGAGEPMEIPVEAPAIPTIEAPTAPTAPAAPTIPVEVPQEPAEKIPAVEESPAEAEATVAPSPTEQPVPQTETEEKRVTTEVQVKVKDKKRPENTVDRALNFIHKATAIAGGRIQEEETALANWDKPFFVNRARKKLETAVNAVGDKLIEAQADVTEQYNELKKLADRGLTSLTTDLDGFVDALTQEGQAGLDRAHQELADFDNLVEMQAVSADRAANEELLTGPEAAQLQEYLEWIAEIQAGHLSSGFNPAKPPEGLIRAYQEFQGEAEYQPEGKGAEFKHKFYIKLANILFAHEIATSTMQPIGVEPVLATPVSPAQPEAPAAPAPAEIVEPTAESEILPTLEKHFGDMGEAEAAVVGTDIRKMVEMSMLKNYGSEVTAAVLAKRCQGNKNLAAHGLRAAVANIAADEELSSDDKKARLDHITGIRVALFGLHDEEKKRLGKAGSGAAIAEAIIGIDSVASGILDAIIKQIIETVSAQK